MSTVEQDKLPKNRYIFCNKCKNETNHICKAQHCRDFVERDHGQIVSVEIEGYRFWICAGCEAGALEKYYKNESMPDDYEDSQYFPERAMVHVSAKRFNQLSYKLDIIYREMLHAYNNKLQVLCAVGIRALLEGICADKNISGKNLELKIENMKMLPSNIVTNLHSLRFIGNEAVHELSAPSLEELRLAIDISEDLLNFLYELEYKTSLLAKKHKSVSVTP